jgi:hypothetical protein
MMKQSKDMKEKQAEKLKIPLDFNQTVLAALETPLERRRAQMTPDDVKKVKEMSARLTNEKNEVVFEADARKLYAILKKIFGN